MAMLVPMGLLLTACSNDLVYNNSVDVHSSGWAPTDTLVFPINVDNKPNPAMPIERHVPYCLGLALRYERYYPCGMVQLHFQLDDAREQMVTLMLGDVTDMPEGETWGSLCVSQIDDVSLYYTFPDSGLYQLKVWPDTLTEHIVSLTATLD